MKLSHKRPHYVPRLYLRGFASEKGQVAIMDKKALQQSSRHVDNICAERDFFTIEEAEEASRYYGVEIKESILDDQIGIYETRVGQILKKIRGANSFDTIHSKDDIGFLIEWMTWLFIANPDTKEFFAHGNRDKFWTQNTALSSFIYWHEKIIPFFLARNWGLRTSKHPLITSDRPVNLDKKIVDIRDINGLSRATISIALSSELLLVGTPNRGRSFLVMKTHELSEEISHFSNLSAFMGAKDLVIARGTESFDRFLLPYR
ncbi:DUF4238 domain-containing protein [Candidatus Dependentiae bacterium]|nr:MAG: DUF4238 domain-containing protein [Candidatus Dependentiae bacterium]